MSAEGASFLGGFGGRLPPGNVLDSNSFKSPFLTDFRKTVETGVDPRLFRIAGLEERTSRWVVMEQLTFVRIFGSTLHRFFAAYILWIMLILVWFERSLLPAQVNIWQIYPLWWSPPVTFQSEPINALQRNTPFECRWPPGGKRSE